MKYKLDPLGERERLGVENVDVYFHHLDLGPKVWRTVSGLVLSVPTDDGRLTNTDGERRGAGGWV